MARRRPRKGARHQTAQAGSGPDVFAECGLSASDFEVESGGGKSFLPGERFLWMTVRHRATGRTASGRIGTTKRGDARQYDELLRFLLRSFRRS